ncbi:MAG TPA: VWA domain-containing protein [Pyrinomonadaceae bacterium]|nr:VWA domain-containing protein [Pyrinomonadaceae bacterium]
MRRSLLTLLLAFSLLAGALGQEPQRPAGAQQQDEADDADVVRISTNLVQVDAVVTDKDGRQVTDLRPEEVEVLEDDRPQKITNFTYVSTGAPAPQPVASSPPAPSSPAAAAPPVRLKREQVRRTIALVVDDLGMSFESTAFVRRALKNFVDTQMQPDDLVAIIRTSAGVGALQQFTSDRRQLYAAIERVRWYPMGRGSISAFAPIERDDLALHANSAQERAADLARAAQDARRESEEEFSQSREEFFAVGTLGAVGFVVRSLGDLPGRKSVLLFSDGFLLFGKNKTRVRNDSGGGGRPGVKGEGASTIQNARVLESLRRLTDEANRASVVIYTMDSRGLQTLTTNAQDSTSDYSPAQLEQRLFDRSQNFFDTQSGLEYMARLTGGFAIRNANDLGRGIRSVLDDQSGYYLIGYRPDESTFDASGGRGKFHKVTLNVKRAGLRVRSRSGFYGVADDEARQLKRASGDNFLAALTSPFSANEVNVRLTTLFGHDRQAGSVVYSMLHVDGRDLTFKEEADGWRVATIDVAAYTFGDYGNAIDSFTRTHTVRARDDAYRSILEDGLVYTLNVPVKKPGAYQLRVAVRDAATRRVGSASQFIEVPNVDDNRLTLSGLVVTGLDPKKADAQVEGSEPIEPQAGPSVRRLRAGMTLRYTYTIYNAQPDRTTRQPQLQTQVRMFRDGRELYTGKPLAYEMGDQPDPKHLKAGGRIQLGRDAQPGEYILQVVVTDLLANKKRNVASQWIDFEIIK